MGGERIVLTRLVWVAPLAAALATVGVTTVRVVAVAVLNPDPRFLPLTPAAPPSLALLGAVAAVALFVAVGRWARRPIWLYTRMTLVALVISLVFSIGLLFPGITRLFPGGAIPGTTPGEVAVLVVMHLVAWVLIVPTLTRLAGERSLSPQTIRPHRASQ